MEIHKRLLLVFLLFISLGYSQNKLLGKVTNSQNEPIANAKIYLDSIYSNVKTNKKGYFEVITPQKLSVINIYSKEYGLLTSKFNNESVMNFMYLEAKNSSKNQTKDEAFITQNIAASSDITVSKYNTIYDLIRGRLPGVSVTNNHITIRGMSSVNYVSEPLFVVDGVIVSTIDQISPNNVNDVRVLKDAAASEYGSQGSSGVILITTKKR